MVPPNAGNLSQQELTNLLGAGARSPAPRSTPGQVRFIPAQAATLQIHVEERAATNFFSKRPCSPLRESFRIADSAAHSVSIRSSDIGSVSEINGHDYGNRNQ